MPPADPILLNGRNKSKLAAFMIIKGLNASILYSPLTAAAASHLLHPDPNVDDLDRWIRGRRTADTADRVNTFPIYDNDYPKNYNNNNNNNNNHSDASYFDCTELETEQWYNSSFGIKLAVPEWEAIVTAFVLSVIIILTIIGNILVILSVFTYKPLRIVQNFFIVSLAVADLTVALLVLPFNVAYSILGRWEFGIFMCKMWLTCDILCCTSSILNLCAIALDRYWAITDPINYAQKRTVSRVLLLIAGVWLLSLLISSPPLLGWNDWPDEFTIATPCELNSDPGYIIYSSLGSFFIPLIIMTIVYMEIFFATRRRLRERAQCSKMNTIALKSSITHAEEFPTSLNIINSEKNRNISSICQQALCCTSNTKTMMAPNDRDSVSSEMNIHNNDDNARTVTAEQHVPVVAVRKKTRRAKIKDSIKHGKSRARKNPNRTNNESKDNDINRAAASGSESLLQSSGTTQEISTESASDSKGYAQTTTSVLENEVSVEEIEDERVTPSASSLRVATPQSVPLQKKSPGVYQFIEEKQKISLSKERRAARTLGIIMGVFVICWLPFFLMYVILPFCNSCCPTNKFKNFITWLGYINSVLNPIIYTIFNLDYRRAFKRLLGLK